MRVFLLPFTGYMDEREEGRGRGATSGSMAGGWVAQGGVVHVTVVGGVLVVWYLRLSTYNKV